jgi:UDP-2-acetamido-2-deoxy-ribo-hexuluronate aminotransferase
MDTLQCAIVLAKLERFEWELERRRWLADRYARLFAASVPAPQRLAVRPDRDCVWAQYTVLVDDRLLVQDALTAAGIPSAVHYPKALHHQSAFAAGQDPAACENSIAAARRVLSLPFSPDLSETDQDRVIAVLTTALNAAAPAARAT